MVKTVDLFEGRSDCNVLAGMVFTAPTFHVERLPLNAVAPENTKRRIKNKEIKLEFVEHGKQK